MNILDIMQNPLTQDRHSGSFLRLVLAEAANYGMPAQSVALLDDIAAMLGFYQPLTANQVNQLAGPIMKWKSGRDQPIFEQINELERLAIKQRALLAFGGAPEHHRVGTAEIMCAMGNTHKSLLPEAYWHIYTWAACDVLSTLGGNTKEAIRKTEGWPVVTDDEVLRPYGRWHGTYLEMANSIRQGAIGAIRGDERAPRKLLRPLAEHFLKVHEDWLAIARQDGDDPNFAKQLEKIVQTIRSMYPDLIVAPETPTAAAAAAA